MIMTFLQVEGNMGWFDDEVRGMLCVSFGAFFAPGGMARVLFKANDAESTFAQKTVEIQSSFSVLDSNVVHQHRLYFNFEFST